MLLCDYGFTWSSTKSICLVSKSNSFFAESKVCHFNISFRVEEKIVELEVSVNDFIFVEELEAERDAGSVEDGPLFGKDICMDVHHKVSAGGVLHYENNMGFGLEAREEVDEEGMADGVGHFEDPFLCQ